MERDEMTEAEAQEFYDEGKDLMNQAVINGSYFEAEEVMYSHFGLEPDYLEDILF